ncbi:hypothetical protein IFR09_15110 [Pseudomonas syringae]|nr:hypothetical protein [Pseudomonas syringae]MBD8574422.1 hypothetical protein [Pseudomonas syringae]MBD8788983.1 hypothetical protein [Pseudomonas syringae]MBD8800573.1 hypothetical protein [Pseudomonas syringae]MBD8812491.1 hypothetical protein [Pseudomonas syringae]
MNLLINQVRKKPDFRHAIYAGDIFLDTDLKMAEALCAFARDSITLAFDGETDHQALHTKMSVETFVTHVQRLKAQFTNCQPVKDMIRQFILEIGLDPADYLFDVPRIRVVPNYDYLHAGVSYAYKPHRDTWYGSPECQINTWMPVYSIEPEQTMMINPAYFAVPVKNSSADWSLAHWINVQRPLATANVTEEVRVHPVPLEALSTASQLRVAGNSGDMLLFSSAHLHGTVANHTDKTRFSVDFRLIHIADLSAGRGAANVDNRVQEAEAGLSQFFYASDFSQFKGINS